MRQQCHQSFVPSTVILHRAQAQPIPESGSRISNCVMFHSAAEIEFSRRCNAAA